MQARMVAIEEKIKQKDAEVAELKTLETQTRSGGSPLHKKITAACVQCCPDVPSKGLSADHHILLIPDLIVSCMPSPDHA